MASMRTDWSPNEVSVIYCQPILDLLLQAQKTHREFHPANEVQMCQLLSIKTGGCPEDCAYCPQSAHYSTGVGHEDMLSVEHVFQTAQKAHEEGATRFCMGAAWREIRDGSEFDRVLEMVRRVGSLGMEVCCTLGML